MSFTVTAVPIMAEKRCISYHCTVNALSNFYCYIVSFVFVIMAFDRVNDPDFPYGTIDQLNQPVSDCCDMTDCESDDRD